MPTSADTGAHGRRRAAEGLSRENRGPRPRTCRRAHVTRCSPMSASVLFRDVHVGNRVLDVARAAQDVRVASAWIGLLFAWQRPCASESRRRPFTSERRRRPGASPPGDCNAKPDHHALRSHLATKTADRHTPAYIRVRENPAAAETRTSHKRHTGHTPSSLRPCVGRRPREARAGGRAHKRSLR